MKKLTGLAAFIFLLLGYDVAVACSCKPSPPPAEALKEARAVFTGEAIRVREPGTTAVRNRRGKIVAHKVTLGAEVRFKVIKVWKGLTRSVVTVYDGPCGFGFVKGGRYLVYAYGDGRLGTSMCSRTKSIDAAQQDLTALGEGDHPSGRNATTRRRN